MSLGWRWGVLALVFGAAIGARLAWLWQADELERQAAGYEQQLAAKDLAQGHEREQAAVAALRQLESQQAQRRELEDRMQTQDQTHWKEMNNAQQAQARLRDRLATIDLRLSVLVDAADSASGCKVPATATTGGLVHEAPRARLDQAAAQRIVVIAGDGDEGLIALAACQSYAREAAAQR
ncbi:lysis system i-spanin subunit Rz [Pseudomonas sp. GM17]|uniref:lysis system i-spanin subunit Rz n=1 Tax=Pseudomonas sp. GM17 TaxID=1144323 RepID=UPI00055B5930|nr:lysis system i-spanin subunit Rz [Pseudomonas sp. GM17]WIE48121.1 lysis system i-spanin subunit Rz [Pseudomonas sp. GM17]